MGVFWVSFLYLSVLLGLMIDVTSYERLSLGFGHLRIAVGGWLLCSLLASFVLAQDAGVDQSAEQDEIPSATWVSLSDEGGFTARIFDLGDNAEYRMQTEGVAFLTEVDGEFQFKRPNSDGIVEFEDVAPGIHMLTYIGQSRFLVSAVHVIEDEGKERLFPSRIDLWCVNFGKREVDSIVLPFLTKGTSGARPEIDPTKVKLISDQRKLQDGGVATLQDVQNIPSVKLVNGSITGVAYRPGTSSDGERILDPLPKADILLVSDEESYSSQKTSDDGLFTFTSIKPGAYALLCTSNGGIAAIGIVVMPEDEPGEGENAGFTLASGRRLVSQLSGGGGLGLQTSPNISFMSGQSAAMAAAGASSSSSTSSSASSAASAAAPVTNLTDAATENPTAVPPTAEPEPQPSEASTAVLPE